MRLNSLTDGVRETPNYLRMQKPFVDYFILVLWQRLTTK